MGKPTSYIRLAHEQGQLPTEIKVPMLEEKNTRTGFATRPQLETIVSHLPEWLQDFVRFAYITCMRKGRDREPPLGGRRP